MISLCEYSRYRRKCVLSSLSSSASRFSISAEVASSNPNKSCNVNLWAFHNLKKFERKKTRLMILKPNKAGQTMA